MRKHFVTFFSPGTFFAETSEREIESWSTALAAAMAGDIVERHNARPYGFRFTTKVTREPVPDGEGGTLRVEARQVAQSALHFIGGEVVTYDQVEARKDPSLDILMANMRGNRWPLVIEVRNGYLNTLPFEVDAIVVDAAGVVLATGADERWATYRDAKIAEWDAEQAGA